MKTIIAATDFSPVSLNAVNFAADLAISLQARLLLFHAYNVPVGYGEVPVMLISMDELKEKNEKELEELKSKLLHTSSGKIPIDTECILGNTVDELNKLCRRIQPFAVVVGAKSKSGLEKMVFGSTALSLIRHLEWPVICIPNGIEFGKGISKIGFACDFSGIVSTAPIDGIRHTVKTFNAELHVINVDFNNRRFTPGTPAETFRMHSLLEDLDPQYHYLTSPDIEDGIRDFAETNNLDLLIVIPKKHKLLEGLFKHSSSKQLVLQSHIPVMCIHE